MIKVIAFSILILVGGGMYYYYYMPKHSSGTAAPLFEGKSPEGQEIALKNFKGKYVFIQFWGSWCGPCRKENRSLVPIYEQYHGRSYRDAEDFDIISIGIDTDWDRWRNAIKKDGLIWPNHLSSLRRFDDPIAKLYGIHSIPNGYLIDPGGNIVMAQPKMAELTEFLDDRLTK